MTTKPTRKRTRTLDTSDTEDLVTKPKVEETPEEETQTEETPENTEEVDQSEAPTDTDVMENIQTAIENLEPLVSDETKAEIAALNQEPLPPPPATKPSGRSTGEAPGLSVSGARQYADQVPLPGGQPPVATEAPNLNVSGDRMPLPQGPAPSRGGTKGQKIARMNPWS